MAGLLDVFNSPEGQQALGLLAAAGPRADGAGFGQRLMEGLGNADAWRMRQAKMQQEAVASQMQQMQLENMKRANADQEAQRAILREAYGNGMPQSSIGAKEQISQGPSENAQSAINPSTPSSGNIVHQTAQLQTQSNADVPQKIDQFTRYRAIADKLAGGGQPEAAQKFYDIAEKFRPKFSTTPQQMLVNGQLRNVLVGEDGTVKTLDGFDVKPDMVNVNLGGKDVWVNKNTVQNEQTMERTQSPDSKASNAVAWANQNLANQKFKYEQQQGNKPQWIESLGGFADPRTQRVMPARDASGNVVEGNGPKMTEDQAKATGWLVQAENAFKNMQTSRKSTPGAESPGLNDAIAGIPSFGMAAGAANLMRGSDRQKYMQAASSLSEALLRAATGAGVNKDEAAQKVKELTPQFGDSPETIKQKEASIPLYIESLKVRSGPGAKKVSTIMSNPAGNDTSDPLGLRKTMPAQGIQREDPLGLFSR
jgi:hypothetical protein